MDLPREGGDRVPLAPPVLFMALLALTSAIPSAYSQSLQREPEGAIIRGDTAIKKLALVFTGGDHGNSTAPILDALKERAIKSSFFVTGGYLRQQAHQPLIRRMLDEGHYLGPHSDAHPLYCDWTDRKKSLITKANFTADLEKNIADLRTIGALKPGQPIYFIPPYEWYNREQAVWCKKLNVRLINFTPGSGSNRDYAPEGNRAFVPSQRIYDDVLAYEQSNAHGLNGFLLLMHLGSTRSDAFHPLIPNLCDELAQRGYEFARVDELLQ